MFKFHKLQTIFSLEESIKENKLEFKIFDKKDECKNLFIIEQNNTPCAIIKFEYYSFLGIEWFEVFPKHQRKGIGINIIQFLLNELKTKSNYNCIRITPLNPNVEQFWKKCGFIKHSNNVFIYYLK